MAEAAQTAVKRCQSSCVFLRKFSISEYIRSRSWVASPLNWHLALLWGLSIATDRKYRNAPNKSAEVENWEKKTTQHFKEKAHTWIVYIWIFTHSCRVQMNIELPRNKYKSLSEETYRDPGITNEHIHWWPQTHWKDIHQEAANKRAAVRRADSPLMVMRAHVHVCILTGTQTRALNRTCKQTYGHAHTSIDSHMQANIRARTHEHRLAHASKLTGTHTRA